MALQETKNKGSGIQDQVPKVKGAQGLGEVKALDG